MTYLAERRIPGSSEVVDLKSPFLSKLTGLFQSTDTYSFQALL